MSVASISPHHNINSTLGSPVNSSDLNGREVVVVDSAYLNRGDIEAGYINFKGLIGSIVLITSIVAAIVATIAVGITTQSWESVSNAMGIGAICVVFVYIGTQALDPI